MVTPGGETESLQAYRERLRDAGAAPAAPCGCAPIWARRAA